MYVQWDAHNSKQNDAPIVNEPHLWLRYSLIRISYRHKYRVRVVPSLVRVVLPSVAFEGLSDLVERRRRRDAEVFVDRTLRHSAVQIVQTKASDIGY